ncbi:hypothetical protein HYY75_05795, partial [bacterium]|nr:hypothetical protein [bacterium]
MRKILQRVDQNGALRYLNAICSIPDFSEKVRSEIESAEKPEDLKKIGSAALQLLSDSNVAQAIQFLKLGASCQVCNFTPDDKISISDPNPPFRKLRHLARLARTYSWFLDQKGDSNGAFEILTSIFMLGQHLEDHGMLISGMIALACRNIAVEALSEFRKAHSETVWKEKLTAFFKKIPKPSFNLKSLLLWERNGIEKILREAKGNHEIFKEFRIVIPASGNASSSDSANQLETSKSKADEENQKQKSFDFLVKLAESPDYDRLVDETLKLYDEVISHDHNSPK